MEDLSQEEQEHILSAVFDDDEDDEEIFNVSRDRMNNSPESARKFENKMAASSKEKEDQQISPTEVSVIFELKEKTCKLESRIESLMKMILEQSTIIKELCDVKSKVVPQVTAEVQTTISTQEMHAQTEVQATISTQEMHTQTDFQIAEVRMTKTTKEMRTQTDIQYAKIAATKLKDSTSERKSNSSSQSSRDLTEKKRTESGTDNKR